MYMFIVYTHIYRHSHIYMCTYVYVYMCVYICICILLQYSQSAIEGLRPQDDGSLLNLGGPALTPSHLFFFMVLAGQTKDKEEEKNTTTKRKTKTNTNTDEPGWPGSNSFTSLFLSF